MNTYLPRAVTPATRKPRVNDVSIKKGVKYHFEVKKDIKRTFVVPHPLPTRVSAWLSESSIESCWVIRDLSGLVML